MDLHLGTVVLWGQGKSFRESSVLRANFLRWSVDPGSRDLKPSARVAFLLWEPLEALSTQQLPRCSSREVDCHVERWSCSLLLCALQSVGGAGLS